MIALYARVSTKTQIEGGLRSQLAEVRRFAQEKYSQEPIIEFIDEGYSGKTLERPGMDALRARLRAQAVRVVLSYDPDRLSRESTNSLILMKEVESAGATFDFVRGGYEQSDSGRLLLQMRSVIAEFERRQIRARTQRGRLEAARRGKVPGGPLMYGYDRVNGMLVVNPTQAEVVRRMFAMVLAGESVREIIAKLNQEGLTPQRGLMWRSSTVHRILRNRAYAGVTTYNRRTQTPTGEITFRPETEWITISLPAIIDVPTFERVQGQLKRNSEVLTGRNDKRFYLLRGLLRCGLCGSRFSGCASHGHRNYRCGGRDRLRGAERCRAKWILSENIENAAKDAIRTVLKSGVLEKRLATHSPKAKAINYELELAKIEREIDTWRRSEERAGRFLVAPEHAERQEIFLAELDRATTRRKAAEQRKASLGQAQRAALAEHATVESVRETCRHILRKIDRLSQEQWREILQILLDEITITGRKLELRGILPTAELGSIPSTTSRHYVRRQLRPPAPVSRSAGRARP